MELPIRMVGVSAVDVDVDGDGRFMEFFVGFSSEPDLLWRQLFERALPENADEAVQLRWDPVGLFVATPDFPSFGPDVLSVLKTCVKSANRIRKDALERARRKREKEAMEERQLDFQKRRKFQLMEEHAAWLTRRFLTGGT